MKIRDRIKELRRVRAGDLLPNPKNWRQHPEPQRKAMAAALGEIGYADALLARETPGGLMLVDGHLRAETTPDDDVPVLVLDVTEAEADKLLATLDPLAAMAEQNNAALHSLLADLERNTPDFDALVSGMQGSLDVQECDAPQLPSGDRGSIQQMTFTLHDDQAESVRAAIEKAKSLGPFVDTGNENSNGNALARACEVFLGVG